MTARVSWLEDNAEEEGEGEQESVQGKHREEYRDGRGCRKEVQCRKSLSLSTRREWRSSKDVQFGCLTVGIRDPICHSLQGSRLGAKFVMLTRWIPTASPSIAFGMAHPQ